MTKQPTRQRNWYKGPYNEQMERLIRDGGTPFSIYDLFREINNVQGEDNDIRDPWWNTPFNSCDGIAYHPNGNIKVVLEAAPLIQIVPENALWKNGLILPDGIYETFDVVELRKDEINKYKYNIILPVLTGGNHLLRNAPGLSYIKINIDPHPKFSEKRASPIIKLLSIEMAGRGSYIDNGSLTDPTGILVAKFTPDSGLETKL